MTVSLKLLFYLQKTKLSMNIPVGVTITIIITKKIIFSAMFIPRDF